MSWFAELVDYELHRAREKFPEPIHSLHEGYAVIKEELDEFWEEVKKQESERDNDRLLREIVQVAAMCERVAEDELGNAVERSFEECSFKSKNNSCISCEFCMRRKSAFLNDFTCCAPGFQSESVDLFVKFREGSPDWCPLKRVNNGGDENEKEPG